jgi:hypothetical protein
MAKFNLFVTAAIAAIGYKTLVPSSRGERILAYDRGI